MGFELEGNESSSAPTFSSASSGIGAPHLGDKDPRAATPEALALKQMQQGQVIVVEEHDLDSLQMK